ncbi:hypothetical protein [Asinibacterium sp. OR53]|jgi:hypothetical protein|uniref:hypothetical protein n=1 Tax=Asinibacterium sp. OR53 TaxID=925409 RepID=UPI000478AEDF|nr:hypothetical protein [Asinibacterium sp. OR53]
MFDQILQAVKDHFANNPELANAIPAEHSDAVHNEIASHIANSVGNQQEASGGGGLLGSLGSMLGSGNPLVSAAEGGLVGSLTEKFGLGSAASGAIAAAIPSLLQKFTSK